MNKKNALLIIDAQNDFCHPDGTLFVPGANDDMERLAQWLKENKEKIDYIGVTLDSHQVIDISHPAFWADKDGNFPPPFTGISVEDVENGIWTPKFYPKEAYEYLVSLKEQGEFPHTIWPEHCLIGSWGTALYEPIIEAITEWCRLGRSFVPVAKGTHPTTEHFGAFRAQVPVEGRKETQLNEPLIKVLEEYQNVFFAGEAKSHCVANTLKQALEYAPNLAQKFVILEDCMSNVPTFERIADNIYAEAKNRSIRFSTVDQQKLVTSTAAAV